SNFPQSWRRCRYLLAFVTARLQNRIQPFGIRLALSPLDGQGLHLPADRLWRGRSLAGPQTPRILQPPRSEYLEWPNLCDVEARCVVPPPDDLSWVVRGRLFPVAIRRSTRRDAGLFHQPRILRFSNNATVGFVR